MRLFLFVAFFYLPLFGAEGEKNQNFKPGRFSSMFSSRPATRPLLINRSEQSRISRDGKKFLVGSSGKAFVPLGFNYDRDYKMRLLEDYWDAEWETVVSDFREMKELGANVVRIHLQFSRFMKTAEKPDKESLAQLKRLLRLAEETGLYLDVTGLACYRKADVPAWFDRLSEKERWAAQAKFWEAIAKTCAKSPAIFCYDLMNEPVFPSGKLKNWLVGELGGFYYVQAVSLDAANRERHEIAHEWISTLTRAIRKHDRNRLITLGLLPTESSNFVHEISKDLDFISVHIYPRSGELPKDLKTLSNFAVGKPLVVEEMFPMNCNADELRQFVEGSRSIASGWMGFYWGQTMEELDPKTKIADAFTREWLKTFRQIRSSLKEDEMVND